MPQPEPIAPDTDHPSAEAIQVAMTIAQLVRDSDGGLKRTDISAALPDHDEVLIGHCIEVLQDMDVLRVDPQGQTYRLSYPTLQGILDLFGRTDLTFLAQQELRILRNTTGETVAVAIDGGSAAINMGRALGSHEDCVSDPIGARYPFHCSATGKTIAAHFSEDRMRVFLNEPLVAYSDQTITNRTALEKELQDTKRRGYGVTDNELEQGRRAIAAPIFDAEGNVVGAFGVTGPSHRVTPDRIPALAEAAKAAARRITELFNRPKMEPVQIRSAARLNPMDSECTSSPKWSKDRQSFYWLDRGTRQLWAARPGEEARALHSYTQPVHSLILTSNQQLVVIADTQLLNYSSGKASLLHTAVQCAVPGTANDIWAIEDRYGEKFLVNVTLDGNSSDHAVLPKGVEAMAYCAVTGSLYLAYPEQGEIQSYNLITRHLKKIAQFPKASGRPIALAIDSKWALWVALDQGWSMIKLNLNGKTLARYNLPVSSPTGLTFGGETEEQILVTSSRAGLPQEVIDHAPLSGQAFVLDLGSQRTL